MPELPAALFCAALCFVVQPFPAGKFRRRPIRNGQNNYKRRKPSRETMKLPQSPAPRNPRKLPESFEYLHRFRLYPAFCNKPAFQLTAPVQPLRPQKPLYDFCENASWPPRTQEPEKALHLVVRIVSVRPAPFSADALSIKIFAARRLLQHDLPGEFSYSAASLLCPSGWLASAA